MELASAFKVFDEVVGVGLEGSIQARRVGQGRMDFVVRVSLLHRTQTQLDTLAAIVERHEVELDVDDNRLAELR